MASQLAEQAFRIGVMVAALEATEGLDVGTRCAVVLGATAAGEALSAALMAVFCRRAAPEAFGHDRAQAPQAAGRRIWEILWPVEGGRCLASALHTAENMLVPACLAVYLGQRSTALAQYGTLKGMALPLVNFPFGLLGSLGVLLMPEITRAHIRANRSRLTSLLRRMLRLTVYFSAFVGMVFWVWGQPLGLVLYGSREAGAYLEILAPALPLLYLESMVDNAMKGIGEQRAAFRYSVWDSMLRIGAVVLLLPPAGDAGVPAGDPAVQPVHLRGQHPAAAGCGGHPGGPGPLAGRASWGGGRRRGRGLGAAPGAGPPSVRRAGDAAAGFGPGRGGHGGGVSGRRLALRTGGRDTGGLPRRKKR